jgi:hypothetical protein
MHTPVQQCGWQKDRPSTNAYDKSQNKIAVALGGVANRSARKEISMIRKLGAWTAVISSIVTVGLTVCNAILHSRVESTQTYLNGLQVEIQKKTQELEVKKERTARYEFVNKLLPDVLKKDKAQVTLTTNLISLALSEEEARQLFAGFQVSQDISVREVGMIGSESLQRNRLSLALAHEKEAFEALIAGDYPKALSEFEATDQVYPTFHQAYEISRLLRQNLAAMREPDKRKAVFRQIIAEYNHGAPAEYIRKLDELSK